MAQKLFSVGTITFTKMALKLCEEHCLNPMDFIREHEKLVVLQPEKFIVESKFATGDVSVSVITNRLDDCTQVLVER